MTDVNAKKVSDKELSYALDILNSIPLKYSYEKICQLSIEQKNTYQELLTDFKTLHEL